MVDTRAENLPEARASANVETLGDVKTDEQMGTMLDALAEAKANKTCCHTRICGRQGMFDTLADTVAETELNKRSNTLENVTRYQNT